MPQTEFELLRRAYDAIAAGDFDAIVPLLHPESKWHGGEPEDGCQNRAQAIAWMRRPEARRLSRLVDVVDAGGGRYVVVLQPGPDAAEAAAGEQPALRANVTTVRDGLVVEMVAHETPESAFAATGLPVRSYPS
ncbi:MAG: nuclear transport factor 2 family protein [Solirubrobacteraceae bacterium]